MRPIRHTKGPLAAASANNIALSQSPTGAFTINGSTASGGVATLDAARRVIFTLAGNETGKTLTLTGTNSQNNPISESLAGTTAGVIQSTLDYKTVTAATISSASAGAITIGTNGVASSEPLPLDVHAFPGITIQVDVTGTLNYTVQQTNDDIWNPAAVLNWYDVSDPNLVGQTANAIGGQEYIPGALRLLINSGSGSALITIIQGGLIT